jgi:hypothetical protein
VSLPKGTRPKKSVPKVGANLLPSSRAHVALNLLRTQFSLQVILAFLLILAFKWPVIHDPPVWDTAMSVFPAAITLDEYDFDLPRLLKEPSYAQAGPNVYAHSAITLFTALIIRITGDTAVFLPTLHLLHFLITALALVATYRYARPILGDAVSLLSVLALLTFPLFLTQAGYMYLEMPLALTTMMALSAWRDERTTQAGLWVIMGCWIKATGIFVGIALTAAAVLGPGGIPERLRRATIVGFLPLGLSSLRTFLVRSLSSAPTPSAPHSEAWDCFILEFSRYLLRVPDLAIFLGLFLLTCSVFYRRIWAGLRLTNHDDPDSDSNQWIALNCLAVLSFLLIIYVVAPLTLGQCFGLPRYYVPVLPFILMTLSFFLITSINWKQTALLLILAIGFFIVNRNGIFYPSDVDQEGLFGNNFALTERSGAYRKLARLQLQAMHFLESLPPGVPIYFGQHEGYLNAYPAMGYVKSTMTNAENIATWEVPKLKQLLSNPPECVYFLYNYPWLGGNRIQILVGKLKATHRSETVRIFRSGEHKITLLRMRIAGSTCDGEAR